MTCVRTLPALLTSGPRCSRPLACCGNARRRSPREQIASSTTKVLIRELVDETVWYIIGGIPVTGLVGRLRRLEGLLLVLLVGVLVLRLLLRLLLLRCVRVVHEISLTEASCWRRQSWAKEVLLGVVVLVW
jgi:hypothetical protein